MDVFISSALVSVEEVFDSSVAKTFGKLSVLLFSSLFGCCEENCGVADCSSVFAAFAEPGTKKSYSLMYYII